MHFLNFLQLRFERMVWSWFKICRFQLNEFIRAVFIVWSLGLINYHLFYSGLSVRRKYFHEFVFHNSRIVSKYVVY